MKIMPKISDLPDYPAIKKLASALHQFDANQHGAAIMIALVVKIVVTFFMQFFPEEEHLPAPD